MTQKNNFKGYKIQFTPQAQKELKKLEQKELVKIDNKLNDLISGAQNLDIKKMITDTGSLYRLRCGDYRVIFEIKNHIVTILIIKIAHRREVYRDY